MLHPGADVVGTVTQDGHPLHKSHVEVAVRCADTPRGFINYFQQIVNVPVDPITGRYLVFGLDSTSCDLGFATATLNADLARSDVAVREGQATTADLTNPSSAAPSPTPTA